MVHHFDGGLIRATPNAPDDAILPSRVTGALNIIAQKIGLSARETARTIRSAAGRK
jgi:hypothetical protein